MNLAVRLKYTISRNEEGVEVAECRFCAHSLQWNTTRAEKHLLRCKPYISSIPKAITPLDGIRKYSSTISKPQMKALQVLTARWLYCDSRPFSTLESKPTKELFQALNPAFKPPCRDQLAGPLLDDVEAEYRAKVRAWLEKAGKLNIIFDALENINGQRVLNVCV